MCTSPEGVTHLIYVGVKRGGNQVLERCSTISLLEVMVQNRPDDDINVLTAVKSMLPQPATGRGILLEHYEGRANSDRYSPKERARLKGASVAFRATWPPEWPRRLFLSKHLSKRSFREIQEKVIQNWKSYGFK
jgi:hypothetical protein